MFNVNSTESDDRVARLNSRLEIEEKSIKSFAKHSLAKPFLVSVEIGSDPKGNCVKRRAL